MALSKDRAAYAREWRRKRKAKEGVGTRANTPLPSEAELEKRGKELAMLMNAPLADLSWPKNLFGDNMTVEELMADGDFKTPKIGRVTLADKCACGCGLPHNNGQSRTTRSPLGNGWDVIWYKVGHMRTARVVGTMPVGRK